MLWVDALEKALLDELGADFGAVSTQNHMEEKHISEYMSNVTLGTQWINQNRQTACIGQKQAKGSRGYFQCG